MFRSGTSVRWEKRIFSHQRRYDGFHLEHSVFDPDTIPVSRAERYERIRVSAAARVWQEIVRVELFRISIILRTGLYKQWTDHQC